MVDVVENGLFAVAEGLKKVLTLPLKSVGAGDTSLEQQIGLVNTKLAALGYNHRLTAPVSVRRVTTDDDRPEPEDCPQIRIVVGPSLRTSYESDGNEGQGWAAWRIQVVSYLSQPETVDGDANQDESLSAQIALWNEALIYAIRRRDGDGVWAWTYESLAGVQVEDVDPQFYAFTDDGLAYACRLVQTWRITQNTRY